MSWKHVYKYVVPVCCIISTLIATVDFGIRIVRAAEETSQPDSCLVEEVEAQHFE